MVPSLSILQREVSTYDQIAFQRGMSTAPWSVVDTFDDVEDKLNAFHLIFNQILDLHAPIIKKLKYGVDPILMSPMKSFL